MKKNLYYIRNIAVIMTGIIVVSFILYTRNVQKLVSDIDEQIQMENHAINEKRIELTEIRDEIERMDTPEYIKKVATEELGMVDEDTIVFKAK